MVKGSGKEQPEDVLVEEVRREVQKIAEGHKTLNQQIDRVAGELREEIKQLDQKLDLYIRGLRKEIVERMDVGFAENRSSIAALVLRFDAHEQAHLN